MPAIGPAGIALIREFEGCRLYPYPDSVGIWTLGVGAIHGPDGRRVTADTVDITDEVADTMLVRDTGRAAAAVTRLIRVPLRPPCFDALVSFAFNLGSGALQASSLRQAINRGEAPGESLFTRWDLAGGRHLPGLRRRRLAEYALYMS